MITKQCWIEIVSKRNKIEAKDYFDRWRDEFMRACPRLLIHIRKEDKIDLHGFAHHSAFLMLQHLLTEHSSVKSWVVITGKGIHGSKEWLAFKTALINSIQEDEILRKAWEIQDIPGNEGCFRMIYKTSSSSSSAQCSGLTQQEGSKLLTIL